MPKITQSQLAQRVSYLKQQGVPDDVINARVGALGLEVTEDQKPKSFLSKAAEFAGNLPGIKQARVIGGAGYEAVARPFIDPGYQGKNPFLSNEELSTYSDPRKATLQTVKDTAGTLSLGLPGGSAYQGLARGSQLGGAVLSGAVAGGVTGFSQSRGEDVGTIGKDIGTGAVVGGAVSGALNLAGRGIKAAAGAAKKARQGSINPAINSKDINYLSKRDDLRQLADEFGLKGGPEKMVRQLETKRTELIGQLDDVLQKSDAQVDPNDVISKFYENLKNSTDYDQSPAWRNKVDQVVRRFTGGVENPQRGVEEVLPKILGDLRRSRDPYLRELAGKLDDVLPQDLGQYVNTILGSPSTKTVIERGVKSGEFSRSTAGAFLGYLDDLSAKYEAANNASIATSPTLSKLGITDATGKMADRLSGYPWIKKLGIKIVKPEAQPISSVEAFRKVIDQEIGSSLGKRAAGTGGTSSIISQVKMAMSDALKGTVYTASPEAAALNQQLSKLYPLHEGLVQLSKKGVKLPVPFAGGIPLPREATRGALNAGARGIEGATNLLSGAANLGGKLPPALPIAAAQQLSRGFNQSAESTFSPPAITSPGGGSVGVSPVGASQPGGQGFTIDPQRALQAMVLFPDQAGYIKQLLDAQKQYTSGGSGKLNATQAAQSALAQSGLRGLSDAEQLLSSDPSLITKQLVPGKFFSREYESAITRAVEGLLRLRTGAVAPDSEVKRYKESFTPQFGDSPEVAQYKLEQLRQDYQNILSQLGNVDSNTLDLTPLAQAQAYSSY